MCMESTRSKFGTLRPACGKASIARKRTQTSRQVTGFDISAFWTRHGHARTMMAS